MNWDQMGGKWKQYKGKIREKWGKLTDDDLNTIAGRREQLVGLIQERYGIAKEEALKQVDTYISALSADAETTSEGAGKSRSAGQR